MRTTINMAEPLFYAVKKHAIATGRTMTSLIEEGLRVVLSEDPIPAKSQIEPLPTFGDPQKKLRFLVDISDREALWAALDADRHNGGPFTCDPS
ncbi:MAG: CopG family transcriptional regulator [Candidatus Dormibacteraceae bacterium]